MPQAGLHGRGHWSSCTEATTFSDPVCVFLDACSYPKWAVLAVRTDGYGRCSDQGAVRFLSARKVFLLKVLGVDVEGVEFLGLGI